LGQRVGITVGADLLESLEQVLVAFVGSGLALGSVQFFAAKRAVTKGMLVSS